MAAAAGLGLPRFGAIAEGLLSSSPPSTSSSSSSAKVPSTFSTDARRGFVRVCFSVSSAGNPRARNGIFKVRSSTHSPSAGVEVPSSETSEASPSPSPLSSSSSASSAECPVDAGPPTIDLEFLGIDKGKDGLPKVDKVSVTSGEKLLRTIMNEQKLELYGLYGKIMNCGGGGSCGTCIVEVLEGSDLLSERTDTEERYLKKNPSTWRLACQTIVGDKTNAGKVVVQRLPQKKR